MTSDTSLTFFAMRPVLTGLAILFVFAGSLMAQSLVIQSPVGQGLALIEATAGYRIEDPRGSATPIDVPPGTIFSTFQELPNGWIAAGHRWTDAGVELVLLQRTGRETGRIEPPAGGVDAFRIAPVPLIQRDRLAGLAWLEGDGGEKNAVMASLWTQGEWEAVRTVSPWTGEAQLALSAAVLEDGSTLLVWAAVEGGDDEVLWSRSRAGGWSTPERVHPENGVPDIMPKVVAVKGGALVAWSQYDGKDYRLRVARFVGGSWSDTGITSEEGADHPTLFPTADGAGFLYRTATPRSWSLIEVEADGRLRHRAATSRKPGEARPLAFSDDPDSVQLRFVTEVAVEEATSDPVPQHRLDWIEQP